MDTACNNTDKELWREVPGDYYADSIHVTEHGNIGINCGGHVIVAPVRKWHKSGELFFHSPQSRHPIDEARSV